MRKKRLQYQMLVEKHMKQWVHEGNWNDDYMIEEELLRICIENAITATER